MICAVVVLAAVFVVAVVQVPPFVYRRRCLGWKKVIQKETCESVCLSTCVCLRVYLCVCVCIGSWKESGGIGLDLGW